jgi:hypothetical protein
MARSNFLFQKQTDDIAMIGGIFGTYDDLDPRPFGLLCRLASANKSIVVSDCQYVDIVRLSPSHDASDRRDAIE